MTQLHDEVIELRRLYEKLGEHLACKLIVLYKTCDKATCQYIKEVEDYIPGTYLDRGYTSYDRCCSVCKYFEHIKTISDGSYG